MGLGGYLRLESGVIVIVLRMMTDCHGLDCDVDNDGAGKKQKLMLQPIRADPVTMVAIVFTPVLK